MKRDSSLERSLRVFSTPLGWMGLAGTPIGIGCVVFGYSAESEANEALTAAWMRRLQRVVGRADLFSEDEQLESKNRRRSVNDPSTLLDDVSNQLRAYARGTGRLSSKIPVDLSCRTEFQKRVMLACRSIPFGRTQSYRELAELSGYAGAARAVGSVMARNPVPLLVPCHRVVATGGILGGFSAPQGLEMKRRLLELEQADCLQSMV